ncbi:MAG TPA: hypothetical protein DCQ31_00030 [Bacteroidales bacterium]|nr:hypothetical protein [Bacteroidales bacterium]
MKANEVKQILKVAETKGLTSLNLSNREITELPSEIGNLITLEHLDLSYNQITELPVQLFNLTNLKTILLVRNKIKVIPPAISNFKNLQLLDVSYNLLSELPKEMGKLSMLESLDAGHNAIARLPIEFVGLTNLNKIFVEENPLVFPPLKVALKGVYSIMHYLSAEDKKLNSSKIMLQVYNMPEGLQPLFNKFLHNFAESISFTTVNKLNFESHYINHDLQDYIELEAGIDNYLYDFLKFIRQNAQALTYDSPDKLKSSLTDLHMLQLRHEINNLHEELSDKIHEIKELQEHIVEFSRTLGDKVLKK